MCVCVCACAYVYCMCVYICMQSDFCCSFNSAVLRPKFGAPNLCGVQWYLFCLYLCCLCIYNIYVCMYVYVCVYMYVCMCVCICVYIYIYIYIYICIYVCVTVYDINTGVIRNEERVLYSLKLYSFMF